MNQANESISSQFISEAGEKSTLDYSLVNSELVMDDGTSKEIYGIRVQKKVAGKEPVTSTIVDITSSKKRALEILNLISKNQVTPITLKDVIENLVADQVN